jgi:hypothetical protein
MTAKSTSSQPIFFALVLDALARIVPALDHEDAAEKASVLRMARILFEELQPADAVEAATAARAIAAHFAAMDNFARACKPGVSDEKAVRLRGNALAASRLFDKELRTLPERRQTPAQPDTQPPARPDAAPRPALQAPRSPASTPEPASNVRHRAETKHSILGLAEHVLQASRKVAWRGGTAMTPPTVLPPG